MGEAVAARYREHERLLDLAREYVERLDRRTTLLAAAVVGSVARGDFNVWSDVDVVVVVAELPARMPDRAALLLADAPPGVQPVGFTVEELAAAWAAGNRLVREAVEAGVVLKGEAVLAAAVPLD